MCLAVAGLTSILSFAVGAAQAVMGFSAQQQQADQQNAYYAANADAARRAAIAQYANEQNAIIQKRNAADQDVLETRIQALQARGTAYNAAGESGVTGLSVNALIDDYYGREGRRVDSIDQNYQMDRDYLRAQMDSTQATAESRINSVQRAQPPSFADAAIRIAGAAVGALGNYTKMTNPGYGYPSMNFAVG